MRRITDIKLTEKEFANIKQRFCFDYGSEADIYTTDKPNTLYKIFTGRHGMSENKLRKIERLYQMSLEHSVKPLSTISCNGKLVGYEMTYDRKDQEFRYVINKLDRAQKIYWLEQTRDILEYFASQDITFGDVASRNILINPQSGEAKFCDIDNIRLGEYPVDITSESLSQYCRVRGVDEEIDAFGHNLMTVHALYISPWGDLPALSQIKMRGMKVYRSLQKPEKFNGEYIIQYVKKIGR